jgi:hypothetical protein
LALSLKSLFFEPSSRDESNRREVVFVLPKEKADDVFFACQAAKIIVSGVFFEKICMTDI